MRKFFKILLFTIVGVLLLAVLSISFAWFKYRSLVDIIPQSMPKQLATRYPLSSQVNPFLGTGGIPWTCANNFPGPSLPFGVMRLSPETQAWLIDETASNKSGYFYGDPKIIGFSHTRLVGTGATDGGNFLVIPIDGSAVKNSFDKGYYEYSHENESGYPGYYSVDFKEQGIKVELTATERVGVHRYTFSENALPGVLLDVTSAMGGKRAEDGYIKIIPERNEMEGHARTFGTFASRYGGIKVYFAAKFSAPFSDFRILRNDSLLHSTSESGNKIKAYFLFDKNRRAPIELKLAISHVSIANAWENMNAEVYDKNFDAVAMNALDVWEKRLTSINVAGGTSDQRTNFYTALYRCFQMPTVFNDVNGQYMGFDKTVHPADSFRYFTDMSIWDTFRTVHPLYTLIAPEDQHDMVVSLVQMAKEGGWLPRWPSGNGYTNSMLGSASDILISEAYQKGIRNFDVEFAYQSMKKTALGSTPKGSAFSGRRGNDDCVRYGFCPADSMDQAVSRTLEYAWSDYSIGLLANALGHTEDATLFDSLSMHYKNVWNPESQYFHPRNANGEFVKEFKPLLLTYLDGDETYTNDYVEGTALQWRWAPFFDAAGLIKLFKNKEYFTTELNDFFVKSEPEIGHWNPGSYYWHGNEPDIHAPYLFNYVDRPDLTQKWVRSILDTKYLNRYDGLDGNDDAATLSAWYVFSALGFYPVAGTDLYQLGAPLFKEAEVMVGDQILKITTKNYAPENIYVKQVWINDTPLDRTWFKHDEIRNGGTIKFEMINESQLKKPITLK